MRVEHWMMFGTFATQRHFVYPSKDTYDGVIINATMAAYAPGGLAGFLLEKTSNIKYIIDPLTHAFQHDPSILVNKDGEVKSSINSLSSEYGQIISDKVGKIPIFPTDFSNSKNIEELVLNSMSYQIKILSDAMQENESMKYLSGEGLYLEPYAIVIPYFFITETTYKDWLEIMINAANIALNTYRQKKIFASIVVSRGLISNSDIVDEIIQAYNNIDVSGFLIWIDDLDESSSSINELNGILRLAKGLRRENSREVINLHGGYFSILSAGILGNNVISGVTHGPEYGEHRSVIPVGGGIPIAKYYIPHLHERIKYRDAARIFKTKGWLENASIFHENVCNCDECKDAINGNVDNFKEFGISEVKEVRRGYGIVRMEYPTNETTKKCLRHYLQRKKREFEFASSTSKEEQIEDLQKGIDEFLSTIGLDGISHLKLWKNIFSK